MCVNGGPALAERRGGAKRGEGVWKAEGSAPMGDACQRGEGPRKNGVACECPFHTNGAVGVHQLVFKSPTWSGFLP